MIPELMHSEHGRRQVHECVCGTKPKEEDKC